VVTAGTFVELLATTGLVIGLAMVALWLVSLMLRNAAIVDLFWGFGFVVIAWVAWLVSPGGATWEVTIGDGSPTTVALDGRRLLLLLMVTLWGLRLAIYLTWRNVGKGEDFRYKAMRKQWGSRFAIASLGTVFLLQGVLMWIVSLPVQAGMFHSGSIGPIAAVGLTLWLVGITFETVGDLQLARFKANPDNSGKVMDRGLWRYTRHPNYFGDACVWWGIYLVALTAATWWTIVGPAVMTLLLLRYSGVALLEKTIATRRSGYAEYAERTNAFFPGPPSPG